VAAGLLFSPPADGTRKAAGLVSSPPAKRLNVIQPSTQPGTSVVVGEDTNNGRVVWYLIGWRRKLHPAAVRIGISLVVGEDTNYGLSPGI